jgi:hypothetical protein
MKPYATLFAIALAGCASGQGQVDVTAANVATFPGAPAGAREQVHGAGVSSTDGYVTVDVQKDLASLSTLGALTLTVDRNGLSGPDLAFIQHIKATIVAEDGKLPIELASDVDVPKNSTDIELPLELSDERVLAYLTEGKVTIHFYVTGHIPERPLALTHTMIAHMSVAVKGSVLKI